VLNDHALHPVAIPGFHCDPPSLGSCSSPRSFPPSSHPAIRAGY
jgi:hypothetical protein